MSRPRPPGGRSAPNSANATRTTACDAAAQAAAALLGREVRRGPAGGGRRVFHHASTVRSGSQCSLEPGGDLGPELGVGARVRTSRGPRSSSAVVVHDPLHVGLVEAAELLREVERLGDALAVGPVGAEQDALDADEVGQRRRGPPRGTA